ncbi:MULTISPECIES: heavy metal-binding domain-containing protein [Microbacterium]|uniref:heavy metal-binding domain-containing protein n=1 Tax=Microbacterium TaxID=33882 RepID=UPI000D65C2C1|nr:MULTISPECIES: heavy metal-binding domain-containing protein [Microbacterium]
MNAAGRLGLFAAGAALAFAAAFGVAAAFVPDSVAAGSSEEDEMDDHGAVSASETTTETATAGVSLSGGGYVLSPIVAPVSTAEAGELSFQILTDAGEPLTEFTVAHEKDLHLIVVRSDGSGFRHVHPTLDERTGTWSLPWQWHAAGTYRVYADFTPADRDAEPLTLSRTVEVAGDFQPTVAVPTRTAQVDGYTVSIAGELTAGSMSDLTISVSRDGEPVTTLEPYLGAFGHLVALREGDLAYLHVHAEGDEPQPGDTSGPEIAFMAEAPTPGRYLLYLDFQVDGQVRTAAFVLDTADGAASAAEPTHAEQAPTDPTPAEHAPADEQPADESHDEEPHGH